MKKRSLLFYMKNMMYLTVLFCLFSCIDKQVSTKEDGGKNIANSLTKQENVVWDDIKTQLLNRVALARSTNQSNPSQLAFSSPEELEEFSILSIPYFDYNDSVFYENPCPESIVNSLSRSKDKVWFVGKNKENKIALMCEAVNVQNGTGNSNSWKMKRDLHGVDYFDVRLAWLWNIMSNSKLQSVRLLNVYDYTYFMLIFDDKIMYYTFLGNKYTDEEFCSHLLVKKRGMESYREFFRNLKQNPKEYMQKMMDSARISLEKYNREMQIQLQ